MIRLFYVLCKLNQVKFTDRQWFEWESGKMQTFSLSCPYCSAKEGLSSFGHYERYLVEWDGEQAVAHIILVKRYRCSSCGRTHAALSSCIVPYKSYSLRFILLVLRAYAIHKSSVEQICLRYGISVSTLYRWLALLKCQKALWLGVLEDAARDAEGFIDDMTGAFLQEFCHTFHFSFLERISGRDPEPPFL